MMERGEEEKRKKERNKRRALRPRSGQILLRRIWCGRVDSNHHGIATASPSSWCVCQFRHDRTRIEKPILMLPLPQATSPARAVPEQLVQPAELVRPVAVAFAPDSMVAQVALAPGALAQSSAWR